VRRAAQEQGCAVSFKIAQILREWEAREKRSDVRRRLAKMHAEIEGKI
jgi:hypothetical protein